MTYAGFSQRLLAHNIDLIPILGLFYLSTLIPRTGYDFFILGGIYIGYYTIFELSPWRATPGKKWVGIHVESDMENQSMPIPVKIILRNGTKIISLILLFGGFIMILFHSKRKALHDYIGGTVVLFGED